MAAPAAPAAVVADLPHSTPPPPHQPQPAAADKEAGQPAHARPPGRGSCHYCGSDADGAGGEEWQVPDDEWGLARGRAEYMCARLCLPCADEWRNERAEAGLTESEDWPE